MSRLRAPRVRPRNHNPELKPNLVAIASRSLIQAGYTPAVDPNANY